MRIVNLETFRSLPANTVFSKYEPCVFEGIAIKGDTWEFDFLVTSNISDAVECSGTGEFGEILFRAQSTGESVNMDFESQGRDGCFDKDQLFAVWEDKDVCDLIDRLKRCIHQPTPISKHDKCISYSTGK